MVCRKIVLDFVCGFIGFLPITWRLTYIQKKWKMAPQRFGLNQHDVYSMLASALPKPD
jgi:hypothetical protein